MNDQTRSRKKPETAVDKARRVGFDAGYDLEPAEHCPYPAGDPLRPVWMASWRGGRSLKARHVRAQMRREVQ